MTNREKINYLRKYKRLDDYVNQLLQDSDALRAKAEKVTATITGMPHGNSGENTREDAISKLVDLSWEINAKIDQYADLGRKIRAEIDAIPDETLRLIPLVQTMPKRGRNKNTRGPYDRNGLRGKKCSITIKHLSEPKSLFIP